MILVGVELPLCIVVTQVEYKIVLFHLFESQMSGEVYGPFRSIFTMVKSISKVDHAKNILVKRKSMSILNKSFIENELYLHPYETLMPRLRIYDLKENSME